MFRDLCDLWVWHVQIFLQVNQGSFAVVSINLTFGLRKCSLALNVRLQTYTTEWGIMISGRRYPDILHLWKQEEGEQSERSRSLLHLLLMSVLWLSRFRRTQLLRWSDWMTEITCLESPTRQLIDNAWHKNVFVYPQIWLWAGSQFLVFFFFGNLIHWTEVDWGESHGSGGLVWESTAVSGSKGTFSRGGGSSTSYSSHWASCVVLKGI